MSDAFQVEGRVLKVLANGTLRVRLSNGHELLAFVAGRDKSCFDTSSVRAGDTVKLQLTAFDLNVGRVLVKHK